MKNVEQCTKCISRFAQDSIFSWHTAKERRRPKEKKLNVSIIFNCRTRRKTVWVNARTRKKERIHNNKRKRETESERRKKRKRVPMPGRKYFHLTSREKKWDRPFFLLLLRSFSISRTHTSSSSSMMVEQSWWDFFSLLLYREKLDRALVSFN